VSYSILPPQQATCPRPFGRFRLAAWWLFAALLAAAVLPAVWTDAAQTQADPPPAASQPVQPASQPAPPPAELVRLTLLHVNDTHGRLRGSADGGGWARLASAIERYRAAASRDENRHVLVLHAGDVLSRGDALTRATLGSANVEVFNRVGLDAWVLGNGDCYDGPLIVETLIDEADFPVLSANVRYRLGGRRIARPYAIFHAGPVRVAVVGLSFIRELHPGCLALRMEDPHQSLRALLPEIEGEADCLVALTHLGLAADRRLGEAFGELDLIVGGHSHSRLPGGEVTRSGEGRSVLLVQAGDYTRWLGRVEMWFRRVETTEGDRPWRYRPVKTHVSLLEMDDSIPQDEGVQALLERLEIEEGLREAPADVPASRPAPVGAGG
jgi:2',3'-cyclic-nucleotide 2'-phosphodiesterase (5'-nucleotidase family)